MRILLVDLKPLLRDIVRSILDEQPDMHVVDEVDDDERVANVVRKRKPDFVIWGIGSGFEDRVSTVLEASPRTRILAIEDQGRRGTLYVLRPHRSSLGLLSKKRLVNAIRTAGSR